MLFSLIIPYYKNEDTINFVLNSLRGALDRCESLFVELVFVNNNSSDCTEGQVKNFIHAKVFVVHVEEKNQGVSNARNAGVSVSSGKYIAFLDADDAIEVGYFLDIAHALESEPDIVLIKHDAFWGEQTYISLPVNSVLKNHLKGWWNCQFVFKKSLASGIKFQGACFEDFGFFPHILARAQDCVVLGRGLYRYCENPASVTKRAIDWRIAELQEQFERLRLSSNELGDDLYKRVQRDFYEHISILQAIVGRFPVLGMMESLTFLGLSESWRDRFECAQRLFYLNGSTLYRPFKGLVKWSSR